MTHPLRSLAARITVLVFLATLVSSMAVSWISLESLDGFLRGKVAQRFPEIARRITDELDEWYSLRAREVEVFATSAILVESLPEIDSPGRRGDRARDEVEQYLAYVLESFPQFERLVIARDDGRTLLEIGGDRPLPEGLLAAWVGPAESTHIGDAHRLGMHLIQIASTPTRNARGEAIATLHAFIDLEGLEPILTSHDLGERARVFVIDRDQRYLNPPAGIPPDTLHASAGLETDGRAIAEVASYPDALGERVIGTHENFARFGWHVVVEQPYDEAFAPVFSSMSRLVGWNLAVVLICGFVAYQIAESIVRPLRALSSAAQRLSRGEREVVIDESHSADEIQVLTRTFNEMSLSLAQTARELEANHETIEAANLELLVKNDELSEMNLVLEQLSITDGLTKLHNHRYFQDAMTQACKRSLRTDQPLSLILIDIDYFKRWNDRLGHAGGDEILRRMAETLNEVVRDTDLLARYGGEEFALLANHTDLEGAVALAEKIRQSVRETEFVTDVPSEKERLTVSAGVALFRGDRKRLFVDADAALYRAKDSGRDCVAVAREEPPTPSRSAAASDASPDTTLPS